MVRKRGRLRLSSAEIPVTEPEAVCAGVDVCEQTCGVILQNYVRARPRDAGADSRLVRTVVR